MAVRSISPKRSGRPPTAHVDVFRNRQIGEKTEFLMDRRDPDRTGVLRGQSRILFSFNDKRPDVWRNQAAENVLKCRFSGAIFTHQRNDLSARDRERGVLQHPSARVALAHGIETYQQLSVGLFETLHSSPPPNSCGFNAEPFAGRDKLQHSASKGAN